MLRMLIAASAAFLLLGVHGHARADATCKTQESIVAEVTARVPDAAMLPLTGAPAAEFISKLNALMLSQGKKHAVVDANGAIIFSQSGNPKVYITTFKDGCLQREGWIGVEVIRSIIGSPA